MHVGVMRGHGSILNEQQDSSSTNQISTMFKTLLVIALLPVVAYSWSCPEGSVETTNGEGCDCGTGFWYDGLSCVDINECQLYKPCQEGFCVNYVGTYDCICDDGFQYDGNTCLDIDECVEEFGICRGVPDWLLTSHVNVTTWWVPTCVTVPWQVLHPVSRPAYRRRSVTCTRGCRNSLMTSPIT
eukprot:sb/3471386/